MTYFSIHFQKCYFYSKISVLNLVLGGGQWNAQCKIKMKGFKLIMACKVKCGFVQEYPVTYAIHNNRLDVNDGIQGSIVLPSRNSEG